MSGITVRTLSDAYSWGATVEGVNWDTLADASVRAQLNAVFEDRGFIVFRDVEQRQHVVEADRLEEIRQRSGLQEFRR